MDKHRSLRRAKCLALFCLLAAAALFIATSLSPRLWWTDLLRAMSEAAMVGALADWFAVTALFRKALLPHTAKRPGSSYLAATARSIKRLKLVKTSMALTSLPPLHSPCHDKPHAASGGIDKEPRKVDQQDDRWLGRHALSRSGGRSG